MLNDNPKRQNNSLRNSKQIMPKFWKYASDFEYATKAQPLARNFSDFANSTENENVKTSASSSDVMKRFERRRKIQKHGCKYLPIIGLSSEYASIYLYLVRKTRFKLVYLKSRLQKTGLFRLRKKYST